MVLKSDIEKAVIAQRQFLSKKSLGIDREKRKSMVLDRMILIITGIRRCGKSTLMLQLIKLSKNKTAFFNFEDPRIFGFELGDLNKLAEILGEVDTYYFDEIQNVEQWEVFARNLHDHEKKLCITGSNASLLSKELGTRLTGRYIQVELFPFSYTEYLVYKKDDRSINSFNDYLKNGGFPEYLANYNREILQQLFKDIVYRDVVVRHGVRNAKTLVDLALFLISNVGKEYSLNKLKNSFEIGSTNSVAAYISWLEDSYLLFSVPRFSWSARRMAINSKKIYTIDTGFAQANSLSFTNDTGRLFENSVFLWLRRTNKEIYYFKEKYECDFVVKELNKVTQVIQVCSEINDDNFSREVGGLMEALVFFDLPEGLIITLDQADILKKSGKTIKLIPAWKWF